MVWKKRLFFGFLSFVRVPPYESWANWTNFYFSCENGDRLLSRKSCNLFHTKNEEKSQKISTRIRIPTCVYANTWQGGLIRPPPTLNRVKRKWSLFELYILSSQYANRIPHWWNPNWMEVQHREPTDRLSHARHAIRGNPEKVTKPL